MIEGNNNNMNMNTEPLLSGQRGHSQDVEETNDNPSSSNSNNSTTENHFSTTAIEYLKYLFLARTVNSNNQRGSDVTSALLPTGIQRNNIVSSSISNDMNNSNISYTHQALKFIVVTFLFLAGIIIDETEIEPHHPTRISGSPTIQNENNKDKEPGSKIDLIIDCALKLSNFDQKSDEDLSSIVSERKGDPRYKAIDWLISYEYDSKLDVDGSSTYSDFIESPSSLSECTVEHPWSQLYALIVLRETFSLSYPAWNHQKLFGFTWICNHFNHIGCTKNKDDDKYKITALHFGEAGNEIQGQLPDEISLLRDLTRIEMYGTELAGSIPKTIDHLKNLQYLYLHSTHLNGEFPDKLIGYLPSLKEGFFENTDLEGTISFCSTNLDHHGSETLTQIKVQADCAGEKPRVYCDCCSKCY